MPAFPPVSSGVTTGLPRTWTHRGVAGGLRVPCRAMDRVDQPTAGHGETEAIAEQPALHAPVTLPALADCETTRRRRTAPPQSGHRAGSGAFAPETVALDLGASHVLALPFILPPQVLDDLLRVSRRRRILRAPRHDPLMPDSRTQYKSKLLGASVSRCVVEREERISRVLTR